MKKKIFLLFLLLIPFFLMGYGYGTEDPLVKGFKQIGFQLTEKDWSGIQKNVDLLEGQIRNAQNIEGLALKTQFKKSLENKDADKLAQTWINLTIAMIRVHLWWNLHENIEDRSKSRPRIDTLDRYLKDILGPLIKKKNLQLHKEISRVIGDMRESLGNPGVFGLGSLPREPQKFLVLTAQFDNLIFEVFPQSNLFDKTDLKNHDVALTLKNYLKKSVNEKKFSSRKALIDQARNLLFKHSFKNWESSFLKMYASMGTPPEGQAEGTPPTKSFTQEIENFLKTIEKK